MEMNLQKYLAFVKTVEFESFTKAAESLGCSQSGISRMIHDLETEWQVSLLERSRAGVQLTSEGLKLLPHAKRLCAEYENLQRQVDEINGLETGLIRIGTFSSVATHWLPNIIREFQAAYPHIDYELLLGDYREIEQWILEGRVDCGFLKLPTHPNLETIVLKRDPLRVVLPRGHPLADAEKFPIVALEGEPFMLLEHGEKSAVSELLERHQVNPNVRFITWEDYAIMSMVESGLGISILPELILQRIPYEIVVKELDVEAYRDICLALKSSERAPLAVKRFLEYLKFRE